MEQTPPGWYPHPDGPLRWWNGQQWANPPSVTPATPVAASSQEAPTARPEPPPCAPPAPPPQREGSGRLPPKARGRGRTVTLVVGGLIAASLVASEVAAFREDQGPALPPVVASVSDPAEGCQRFLSLVTGLLRDKPNDRESDRRFEQLRDAARDNDPLLASDVQDMLNGDSAADVSAASQIILRRCGAAGHITLGDVDRLGGAASAAIGNPVATPSTSPAAEPPPARVQDLEPQDEPAQALSPGQPACTELMPILEGHISEVEQWLESFEGSGVAGAPWASGVYVTLGSLSPETGDPIKQTITVNEGLLDDYDLDYEASKGNIPNRAFIYIRQGRLVCEVP